MKSSTSVNRKTTVLRVLKSIVILIGGAVAMVGAADLRIVNLSLH